MSKVIKLSHLLKQLMDKHQLTTASLARITGIGQPVIYRLVSGETDNPKIATLSPIARHFNLSISQLIGDDTLPNGSSEQELTLQKIPILSWEEVLHWQDNTLSTKKFITTTQAVSVNAYALITKDTTMQPKFPENTTLLVDPDLQPKNRDYVIVNVGNNEQATFKQLLFDGSDKYLKPLNADFKVTRIDNQPHRFLGVVTEARIKL